MAAAIRIIGIDPGLRRTGWGVVEAAGNSLTFIAAGTLKSSDKAPLASRLRELHDGLRLVIGRQVVQQPRSASPHPGRGENQQVGQRLDGFGRNGPGGPVAPVVDQLDEEIAERSRVGQDLQRLRRGQPDARQPRR